MKVSDIMTRRVISIAPDATLLDAIGLMLKHHISGLPVIDHDHKLVGIVSEGDFLHRAETGTEPRRSRWFDAIFGPAEAAEAYVRSHGMKIGDIMTKQVVTANEQMLLDEVVHLLEVHNIKRVPVVRDRKVVGIVTRTNLMHALASMHRGTQKSNATDASLRERILREVDHQSWAVGAHVDVVVRNGLADLWGTISDIQQRNALRVLVENTPGVKIVVDHLRWQDTTSPT
jgi:CBS domain-containing protein